MVGDATRCLISGQTPNSTKESGSVVLLSASRNESNYLIISLLLHTPTAQGKPQLCRGSETLNFTFLRSILIIYFKLRNPLSFIATVIAALQVFSLKSWKMI